MYVKFVYIVSKCHKNSTRMRKKMSFCDKMAKKNGGGTPYLSISNMLLGFHAGTSTFLDQVPNISPP